MDSVNTRNTAYFSVDEGLLKIRATPSDCLLTGSLRTFFVSVLGFKLDKSEKSYSVAIGPSSPKTVEQAARHLERKGVRYEFSAEVESLLALRASQEMELKKSREAGMAHKALPTTVLATPALVRALRPYQIPAVAHMMTVRNSANFSVPGSGKTGMVWAAFSKLVEANEVEKILVVGPRSSFMAWEDEYQECFGRAATSIRIVGARLDRNRLYSEAATADLVLISYQMIANDADRVMAMLRRYRFMMVLDESHYIKRLDGGVWATTLLELAPLATRRLILSGTPVPNGFEDLWSQFTFLWPLPPILGARDAFKTRVAGSRSSLESIRDEISPFFWRVKKSDVGLPRPIFHRPKIKLRQYQQSIYDALAAKVLADVEKRPTERDALREWRRAKMVRLLQSASNPSLLSRGSPEFKIPPLDASGLSIEAIALAYSDYEVPAKLDFACELTESLVAKGLKVVVWTAFVHNILTLEARLAKLKPVSIHGGVPKDENEDEENNRESIIRRFNTSPDCCVLIANPGACAESISLHRACSHAIYLDRSFNGAQYMQSLDRIHRLGMPQVEVHYYLPIAEGTIDEVIDSRLEEKQRRLLTLLEGDFQELSFESAETEFSEDKDEADDFDALVQYLREKIASAVQND
jgi:SNF2 family DNA or RNA helicase